MNKSDLIKKVSKELDLSSKEVSPVINCFFEELSEALKDENVFLKDFGSFKKVLRKARIAHNPSTGEAVEVPEKEIIKFKPSINVFKIKELK
ncbi:MAG: integration host factor subunit beta [Massilibacteroides sp.]|nr:integration host factor subunit beta [Massilibacteroides sp.]